MPRKAKQKPASVLADPILAGNIRRLLEMKGMRPADLARQLGITSQSVSQWLLLQSAPDRRRLAEIAVILGVSVETLRSRPAEIDRQTPLSEGGRPENRLRLRHHQAGAAADDEGQDWCAPAAAFRDLATNRPDLVIIGTPGSGLEPDLRAGELVVIDCKSRQISGRGVYLIGNMTFPILKLCEPAAARSGHNIVYVYEAAVKREVSADELTGTRTSGL